MTCFPNPYHDRSSDVPNHQKNDCTHTNSEDIFFSQRKLFANMEINIEVLWPHIWSHTRTTMDAPPRRIRIALTGQVLRVSLTQQTNTIHICHSRCRMQIQSWDAVVLRYISENMSKQIWNMHHCRRLHFSPIWKRSNNDLISGVRTDLAHPS